MLLLSILNLTFTDLIALVLTPAAVATISWIKFLQADRDKHAATIEKDLAKETLAQNAAVEKHRITVQGEVEKAREMSVGGAAVIKIWKEVDSIKNEIEALNRSRTDEHENNVLINEIVKRLQEDINRLMKVLFDNFITK